MGILCLPQLLITCSSKKKKERNIVGIFCGKRHFIMNHNTKKLTIFFTSQAQVLNPHQILYALPALPVLSLLPYPMSLLSGYSFRIGRYTLLIVIVIFILAWSKRKCAYLCRKIRELSNNDGENEFSLPQTLSRLFHLV